MLITICAWCQKPLGEVEDGGEEKISHGICQSCLKEYFPEVSDEE